MMPGVEAKGWRISTVSVWPLILSFNHHLVKLIAHCERDAQVYVVFPGLRPSVCSGLL